jgi:hypothetical protein
MLAKGMAGRLRHSLQQTSHISHANGRQARNIGDASN